MTARYQTDFTHGRVMPQLLMFALPLFLSSLLQIVYNMVDMIVVGQVMGKVGLSAVAVGGDVCNFLTFVAMGFSSAGQVIISQYLGAGRGDLIGRFIGTMFAFLSLAAFGLGGFCFALRVPILSLMNTPPEAFSEAMAYSNICIAGLFFIYGYNAVAAVLRGMGDSKHPFVFISIAALLNVVLDIIFVVYWHMGAGGAALATVISQGVSFVSCAIFLAVRRDRFGISAQRADFFRFDRNMLGQLIRLGVPMALKGAAIQSSKLFVNSWINSYGVAVSAFAGIANKINSISNLVSNSLNWSGSSMIGQNIGAKSYARVGEILRAISVVVLGMGTLMSLTLWLWPEAIFRFFTDDAEVLAIGLKYVPIGVLIFYGSAVRAPSNALINGSGNYRVNLATAILDGIVLRIGLALLLGLTFNMKHYGFWLGDALAGFTPLFIAAVFYATGRWKNTDVLK